MGAPADGNWELGAWLAEPKLQLGQMALRAGRVVLGTGRARWAFKKIQLNYREGYREFKAVSDLFRSSKPMKMGGWVEMSGEDNCARSRPLGVVSRMEMLCPETRRKLSFYCYITICFASHKSLVVGREGEGERHSPSEVYERGIQVLFPRLLRSIP